MNIFKNLMAGLILGLVTVSQTAWSEELDADIVALQHEWAKANYHTAKDAQEASLKALAERAHEVSGKLNQSAEALIWEGIINATYAKAKGGIGALKYAEKARDLLLASEKTNPNALQGAAYTSLGSLFYKVPGWPIGFGDKKKAKAYLEKALKANPNGIDSNFFYGDFLNEQGQHAKAIEYFKKALAAPARPGREDADAGRKGEIEEGLKKAESKL